MPSGRIASRHGRSHSVRRSCSSQTHWCSGLQSGLGSHARYAENRDQLLQRGNQQDHRLQDVQQDHRREGQGEDHRGQAQEEDHHLRQGREEGRLGQEEVPQGKEVDRMRAQRWARLPQCRASRSQTRVKEFSATSYVSFLMGIVQLVRAVSRRTLSVVARAGRFRDFTSVHRTNSGNP